MPKKALQGKVLEKVPKASKASGISPKREPLLRHRIVFKEIVANRGKVPDAIRSAGYPESTARNPQRITRTRSFLQICEENGLTDDRLTGFLNEDIEAKKGNRKAELELAFKIKGRLSPDVVINQNKNLGIVYLPQATKEVPKEGEDL